uniref:RNA-binding protein n=1 Tax=Staphylothermus marinus TaxID=2280 RepID=A0A7C4H8S5_STAMA
MTSFSIAIPSSILSVEPDLLFKTIRIHQVIRYCSIFRVYKIVVYRDPFTNLSEHFEYVVLFSKIDRFIKTPPYLRKKLVPLDDDLKYVGVLPPLRLLIYSVSKKGIIGEKRLGVIVENDCVDIGLNKCFKITDYNNCSYSDELITVEIVSLDPPLVKCIDDNIYRGPVLEYSNSFSSAIDVLKRESDLLIATSRRGVVPKTSDLLKLSGFNKITLFFGSPHYGLYEIAERENIVLENVFDYVWNTIPRQGVKTVRTEEALISTLAILNIIV